MTFSHLYVVGIELNVTVEELAVNRLDEISSYTGLTTVAVSNCIPDVAVDRAVRICPFVPTGTLDLEDPLLERISPFALVGLIPIDAIGIMTS
jgi:hypothetical protein